MLNEESGETSFSVLSRCCLGDTSVTKFDHLKRSYQQIHAYIGMSRSLVADAQLDNWRTSGRVNIRKLDTERAEVVSYVRGVIRAACRNQHTMYDDSKQGYRNKRSAAGHQVTLVQTHRMLSDDSSDRIVASMVRLRQRLCGFWAHNFADVWPAAAAAPSESSSDFVSASDSSSEDQNDSDDDVMPGSHSLDSDRDDLKSGSDVDRPMDVSDHDDDESLRPRVEDSDDESDPGDDQSHGPSSKSQEQKLNPDERDGNPRGWNSWGQVHPDRIMPYHRRRRRNRGKRQCDVDFPIVNDF